MVNTTLEEKLAAVRARLAEAAAETQETPESGTFLYSRVCLPDSAKNNIPEGRTED